MLTCICCGPEPIENGIPGYLNFQEQKASQLTVNKGPSIPELRAKRTQQSIAKNCGRLFLSGVLSRANAVTSNGRVYDKGTLKRAGDEFHQNLIRKQTAFGELEHPHSSSPTYGKLHLATISHQVVEMWWHADELHGLIEVLDTPAGRLVRSLYCQGIMLGASSRGHSSLIHPPEGQKHTVVGPDWQLITFDLLTMPATTSYLFAVREQLDVPPVQPGSVQAKILRGANQSLQVMVQLYPKFDAKVQENVMEVRTRMQASASQQEEILPDEQPQIIEGNPRRSLGALSTAVARHMPFSSSQGTGKEERLLAKHPSSSDEALSDDTETVTIKARHGQEASHKRPSVVKEPWEDTKERLQKMQKFVDVVQFGKLEWLGGKVSKEQQGNTSRFCEKAIKAQPHNNGPPVIKKNPPPPLRAVPGMQHFLHSSIRWTPTDEENSLKTGAAEKAPNGYPTLHKQLSAGEWDEMQMQESTVVTRVPEQVVKQQLEGDCTAPQPVVS